MESVTSSAECENQICEKPRPKVHSRKAVELSRRNRTTFSKEQTQILELEFMRENYISRTRRHELATLLKLPEATIKVWYQNRRMQAKRQRLALFWPWLFASQPNSYAQMVMQSMSQSEQPSLPVMMAAVSQKAPSGVQLFGNPISAIEAFGGLGQQQQQLHSMQQSIIPTSLFGSPTFSASYPFGAYTKIFRPFSD